jgi:hypothetical protein
MDRLISLGARPGAIGRERVDRVVMFDPDGNEFCLVNPR